MTTHGILFGPALDHKRGSGRVGGLKGWCCAVFSVAGEGWRRERGAGRSYGVVLFERSGLNVDMSVADGRTCFHAYEVQASIPTR